MVQPNTYGLTSMSVLVCGWRSLISVGILSDGVTECRISPATVGPSAWRDDWSSVYHRWLPNWHSGQWCMDLQLGPKFTFAKYYQFYFKDIVVHEAYKWIWKSKCVMKLKVFAWLLLSDILNTKNMLRPRHYIVGPPDQQSDHCILCRSGQEETLEHLFFRCTFLEQCWASLNIC